MQIVEILTDATVVFFFANTLYVISYMLTSMFWLRLLAVIAAAREFGSAPGSQEENIQRTADIRRARHTLGDANLGDERPSLVRQGAHMKATQPVAQDPALSAPMLVFGLSSHPFALFEPSPRLAQVNKAPDRLLHTSA